MQDLYFFFDDSGVLNKNNPAQKFIYAGYFFQSRKELDAAKRKYHSLVKNIQAKLELKSELKAFGLSNKHKRALYNVLKFYESLSVILRDVGRIKALASTVSRERKGIRRQLRLHLSRRRRAFQRQSKGLPISNAEKVSLVCVREEERLLLRGAFIEMLRGEGLNAHSFRHTHTTQLIENGASAKGVAERLSHADATITQKLYTHNTEKLQKKTVTIFDKTLQTKLKFILILQGFKEGFYYGNNNCAVDTLGGLRAPGRRGKKSR